MKLLLSQNVSKLGKIGDIVEVAEGYARNYLLPQQFAVAPTEANLKAVEAAKAEYLAKVAAQRAELEAKADVVRGKEVSIAVRANEEGHLYGSVGPAQISAALAEEGVFVEPMYIILAEPIRQLDKYDVTVEFSEDVTATIHVWIVPSHTIEDDGESHIDAADADADEAPADESDDTVEA